MKALEVVKYFIYLHKQNIANIQKHDQESESEALTHLKIQKLLYYSQALSLVYLNKPLFDENIEAWEHGPVVNAIYYKLKSHGKDDLQNIEELQYTNDILSADEKSIVEMAFREYARYTASYLRNKTHEETPWLEAWDKGKNTIISHDKMREFFKKEQKNKAKSLYIQSEQFRCLFS